MQLCFDYVTSHKPLLQLFSFAQTQNSDIFSVNVESLWWWALNSVLKEGLWVWLNPGATFLSESLLGGKVFKARRWSNFLFLALQVSVNPAYQASELEFVLRKVRMARIVCWRGWWGHGADELLKIWVYGRSRLEIRAGGGCVEGLKLQFSGHISCCSLWLPPCLMETAVSFSSLSLSANSQVLPVIPQPTTPVSNHLQQNEGKHAGLDISSLPLLLRTSF